MPMRVPLTAMWPHGPEPKLPQRERPLGSSLSLPAFYFAGEFYGGDQRCAF